jgi:mannose-6-phosphate isomerase
VFEIVNDPRDYSWGSRTAIAELLGRTPTGVPEAELWFGDHPASPARIVPSGVTLSDWGRLHPADLDGDRLPFLVKVLAAETPLSLQAHPTLSQAIAGFARENASGISLDDPARTFRDDNHKPEVIIALSEFSALCGFRTAATRARIVEYLERRGVPGANVLRGELPKVLEALLTRVDGVPELVATVSELDPSAVSDVVVRDAIAVATMLAHHYPGDPGIVVSLILNHRVLQPGEALFLPAGNIHAYLHGVGIEVMAASDNVVRGGLTEKHIDVPLLLEVLDFSELNDPSLAPMVDGPVRRFAPGIPDFAVLDVTVSGETALEFVGPAIAVVVDGVVEFDGDAPISLSRGHAAFVPAGEKVASLRGVGHVFVATRP